MKNKNKIEEILTNQKITHFGICQGELLLPFFQNGATRRLEMEVVSVVTCLFPYKPKELPKVQNVALYAIYPDYHHVIGQQLEEICQQLRQAFPTYQFKGYVDVSPIDEIRAGELCGLGNRGDNGLLIHKDYGALHFIGCILSDMPIPSIVRSGLEGCVHCGRCVANCPAHALGGGFRAKDCLSAVTQRKGQLTPSEQLLVGKQGYIWGCDCCSLSCPIAVEGVDFSCDQVAVVTGDNLKQLLETRAFAWRGEKVLLRNMEIVGGTNGT